MKTVLIDYAMISPLVLSTRIERAFQCICFVRDVNANYFELTVCYCPDLAGLEDILAEYV